MLSMNLNVWLQLNLMLGLNEPFTNCDPEPGPDPFEVNGHAGGVSTLLSACFWNWPDLDSKCEAILAKYQNLEPESNKRKL